MIQFQGCRQLIYSYLFSMFSDFTAKWFIAGLSQCFRTFAEYTTNSLEVSFETPLWQIKWYISNILLEYVLWKFYKSFASKILNMCVLKSWKLIWDIKFQFSVCIYETNLTVIE